MMHHHTEEVHLTAVELQCPHTADPRAVAHTAALQEDHTEAHREVAHTAAAPREDHQVVTR